MSPSKDNSRASCQTGPSHTLRWQFSMNDPSLYISTKPVRLKRPHHSRTQTSANRTSANIMSRSDKTSSINLSSPVALSFSAAQVSQTTKTTRGQEPRSEIPTDASRRVFNGTSQESRRTSDGTFQTLQRNTVSAEQTTVIPDDTRARVSLTSTAQARNHSFAKEYASKNASKSKPQLYRESVDRLPYAPTYCLDHFLNHQNGEVLSQIDEMLLNTLMNDNPRYQHEFPVIAQTFCSVHENAELFQGIGAWIEDRDGD